MSEGFVYVFLLLLSLFRHGISVPVPSNFYIEDTQNQGPLDRDDITVLDSYERFPRNAFSTPYYLHGYPSPNAPFRTQTQDATYQENRLIPRSRVSARPQRPNKKHLHLFHLTAKHPNAVAYNVIQKPAAARTITVPEKSKDNSHSNGLYNSGQHQSYPMQPYYQQSTSYQSPGYPSPNAPYGLPQTQDTTYQDILKEVANPLQYTNNPSTIANGQTVFQNDNSLEEAAKQFSLASADMTNMELAALIMYPVPSLHEDGKVHKKKHKSKKERKKNKKKMIKFQSKSKPEIKLVDQLIKSEKDKKEEEDMDYDGSGSGDTWDEEDTSTTADQGYTSNKRSKIVHVNDSTSDSNSDKGTRDSTADEDIRSDADKALKGYVNEGDSKDAVDDSNEKKESQKIKSDSDETDDQEGSGAMENEDKDEESDVKDDDSDDSDEKIENQKLESDSAETEDQENSDVKDDDSQNKEINSTK